MRRTKGVNKAQAVRDFLRQHPRAKPKAIVEALAKQGIKITLNYVSWVKCMRPKRGRPRSNPFASAFLGRETRLERGRPPGKAVAASGVPLGMPEIKAALALIKLCGGILSAKEALAAAAEIKALV